MRGGMILTLYFLCSGPFAAAGQQPVGQQPAGQQDTQPPAQKQKTPPNSNNGDIPDPTKDPAKDPATDITKDPTKDPDAAAVAPQSDKGNNAGGNGGNANAAGGDAGGGVDAPDYTGPAILSRSFSLSRPSVPRNEHFQIYAGINATYDSGLSGQYLLNAVVPAVSTFGADFNWGASLLHYRRKDIIQFDYSGHYYEYGGHGTSPYDGQDHSLSAGYTREISPRFTFGFRETAGLYSNTYSVLNSTGLSDVSQASGTLVVAPNTEAFNDRTYYSTSSASMTYHKTARLSFNIGVAYFLVRRNSLLLADTNGYQISADAAYRINRTQTVGLYYTHSEYSYRKIFGDSNADSVGFDYSIALTRTTSLAIRAGGTRFDSQSLGEVTPNPLVQQVLGIVAGVEKFYFVGYAPDVSVSLDRRLRQSSVGASFVEGITPGNGLILTSKHQSESVYYNLPTFRKTAAQFGAGRDVLGGYADGIGTTGNFSSYYFRFTLSRPVTRVISSYFNVDYRQYGFAGTTLHQHEYRVSLGLRFSPGTGLMKLW
jgi:hypothetical protein